MKKLFFAAFGVTFALLICSAFIFPRRAPISEERIYQPAPPKIADKLQDIDFPNTTVSDLLQDLADLYVVTIHSPKELSGKPIAFHVKNVGCVDAIKAALEKYNVAVIFDGREIHIINREVQYWQETSSRAAVVFRVASVAVWLVVSLILAWKILWTDFLVRHNVDVGRTAGVICLVSTFWGVATFVGGWLVDSPPSWDFSILVGLLFGVGLWRHWRWARLLSIWSAWLAAFLCLAMDAAAPFFKDVTFTLTVGSESTKNPPLWKTGVFLAAMGPVIYLWLAALHSQKARSEFGEKPVAATPPIVPLTADQSAGQAMP